MPRTDQPASSGTPLSSETLLFRENPGGWILAGHYGPNNLDGVNDAPHPNIDTSEFLNEYIDSLPFNDSHRHEAAGRRPPGDTAIGHAPIARWGDSPRRLAHPAGVGREDA